MQLERNQSHHRVAELPRDPKNLHSPRIHLFLRQRIPFQILFILTQQVLLSSGLCPAVSWLKEARLRLRTS
jgi:hypothetical protein